MQTNYVFRNLAVNNLLGFQEKDFVFDFFHYYQSHGIIKPNKFKETDYYRRKLDKKVEWYENALQSFKKEINQVIHTTHQLPINQYFEDIKKYRSWLCVIEEDKLRFKFNGWNEENYNAFIKEVEEEAEKYFQSENRKMKHLEEYDVPDYSIFGFALSTDNFGLPRTRKEINYNYFAVEEIPSLIDLTFMPEYLHFLNYVNEKFASAVDEYIDLYDRGKIVSSSTTIVNHVEVLQVAQAIVPGTNKKQLPDRNKQKIKWNRTPQEFVELFSPMITGRSIYLNKESESDTDPIVSLLYDTFEIKKAKGDGELSLTSLSTYFKEYNSRKVS